MTGYFDDAATRREGATGSFTATAALPEVEAGAGITVRPAAGEQLMLSFVTLAPHSEAPVHTHDEEQMGVVTRGSCEFELDGEIRHLTVGDIYLAPPGVPHGARTGDEACEVIDAFSPPRAALLALLDQAT